MNIKFIATLLLISLVLLGAHLFIRPYVLDTALHPMVYFTYFIIWVITVGFHIFLSSKKKNQPKTFVTLYMAAIGLKMFLSLLVFLIIGLLFKPVLAEISIAFLTSYLLFSGIETYQLIKELKEHKELEKPI